MMPTTLLYNFRLVNIPIMHLCHCHGGRFRIFRNGFLVLLKNLKKGHSHYCSHSFQTFKLEKGTLEVLINPTHCIKLMKICSSIRRGDRFLNSSTKIPPIKFQGISKGFQVKNPLDLPQYHIVCEQQIQLWFYEFSLANTTAK